MTGISEICRIYDVVKTDHPSKTNDNQYDNLSRLINEFDGERFDFIRIENDSFNASFNQLFFDWIFVGMESSIATVNQSSSFIKNHHTVTAIHEVNKSYWYWFEINLLEAL